MSTAQLAEIVGTLLGYQGTDKRAHPYDVWFVADQLRGARIADYVAAHGDSVLGQFCTPIIYNVQFDTSRNRPYIDFGTQVLGLEKNKGIIQVTLPQEEDADFIIRQAGMNAVYGNLIEGQWPDKKCWIEGTRMYFYQLDPQQTQILVKAIPSLFHYIFEEDNQLFYWESPLPQPYEFNAFLIEGARAWFEEQKYSPDSRANLGVEARIPQPRQILQTGLPQAGQGAGIGAAL
jgi:hypothetical protein